MLDDFQLKAIISLVVLMSFHLIPTIILSFIKKGLSQRPIWTTYLVWFAILPLLFGPLIWGKLAFTVFCLIISCFGILEFFSCTDQKKDYLSQFVIIMSVIILYVSVFTDKINQLVILNLVLCSIILGFNILKHLNKVAEKSLLSIFLFVYLGGFISLLPFIYNLKFGRELLFTYIFIIINNDAFSYLVGSVFGKHKLIPSISPNKSVEGLLGGVISSILILTILKHVFVPVLSYLDIVAIGVILSLGGTLGDLVMSMFKRSLNLKDFGDLIPGHGGILDRIDSLIFIAPIYYLYVSFIIIS